MAIYEIGCFFGAGFTLFAGEKLGRRWMIMLGSVILAIGAVLQAAAYGIPQLIVGRIVAGLGNGMNTATIPVSRGLEKSEKEKDWNIFDGYLWCDRYGTPSSPRRRIAAKVCRLS